MDRQIFKSSFKIGQLTQFQCPSCGNGRLKANKEQFKYEESKESLSYHNHPNWEPEFIVYRFSCLLECTTCHDHISCSGNGSVEDDYDYDENGEPTREYVEYFKPKFFYPNLRFFEQPKQTPEKVTEELDKSFSLAFTDPQSATNHVRIALEYLLTHLKIRRTRIITNSRTQVKSRVPESLHNRINLLPKKYNHIKEIFIATKWIGNAGSHSEKEIKLDDVLDAYELVSELLTEIFDDKKDRIDSIVKRINKNKGP